jgi:hypothetical protein
MGEEERKSMTELSGRDDSMDSWGKDLCRGDIYK